MIDVYLWEAAVRKLIVTLGAIALALPLLAAPAFAKPDAPLGVVMLGNRANVGLAAAASGTSVYNGDTLTTDASGTLRVRFGGAQIMLGPSTTVDLHEQDGMVDVILRQGNVRFAGMPGSPIEVHVLQALVRTNPNAAATGQVAVVNSREFQVASEKGDFDCNVNGEDHVISAPHAYDLKINAMPLLGAGAPASAAGGFTPPARQDSGQDQGSNNNNNNNNNNKNNNKNKGGGPVTVGGGTTTITIAEVSAVVVASAVVIYLACESPSKL